MKSAVRFFRKRAWLWKRSWPWKKKLGISKMAIVILNTISIWFAYFSKTKKRTMKSAVRFFRKWAWLWKRSWPWKKEAGIYIILKFVFWYYVSPFCKFRRHRKQRTKRSRCHFVKCKRQSSKKNRAKLKEAGFPKNPRLVFAFALLIILRFSTNWKIKQLQNEPPSREPKRWPKILKGNRPAGIPKDRKGNFLSQWFGLSLVPALVLLSLASPAVPLWLHAVQKLFAAASQSRFFLSTDSVRNCGPVAGRRPNLYITVAARPLFFFLNQRVGRKKH